MSHHLNQHRKGQIAESDNHDLPILDETSEFSNSPMLGSRIQRKRHCIIFGSDMNHSPIRNLVLKYNQTLTNAGNYPGVYLHKGLYPRDAGYHE